MSRLQRLRRDMPWRSPAAAGNSMRRFSAALVLLAAASTGAVAADGLTPHSPVTLVDPDDFDAQRYRNSVALHAKLLCSGIFVSGRDPDAVIEQDLHWSEDTFHDWDLTEWIVDRDAGRVDLISVMPRSRQRVSASSVYHPGHGCTLLPAGAERVAFEPRQFVDAASKPIPPEAYALPVGRPANAGRMQQALEFAFANERHAIPQQTRALVVIHKNAVVAEAYAPGFTATMPMLGWSMGKSLSAALLGVVVRETGLDVEQPAPIQAWRMPSDPRSTISPLNLLQMAGGLRFRNPGFGDSLYYTDRHQHESVYFKGQDTERLVLEAPLRFRPGTVFQYRNTNTLAIMSLIKQINRQAGKDHLLWPHRALLARIGAGSFVLEPDTHGNLIITGNVYATARDWGRAGLLFLNRGRVGGESLWPDDWLDILTRPSTARSSYGGQIWLNTTGVMPDVPGDAFFFRGWLGQLVVVIPSRDAVIVRLGFSDAGGYLEHANVLVSRILVAL